MVAANIEMENLRIESTPFSDKCFNVGMAPSLQLQAARPEGQPCNNGR
jgi:hypothetical protein